jgi:uncharacterized protein (DUF433 family)
MRVPPHASEIELLGIGLYTVPVAARLLRMPRINIRRWLGGYSFRQSAQVHQMPPLWAPDIPIRDGHLELSFRDLIELRFVHAFVSAGVGLLAIRNCLDYAREVVGNDRPFSTSRFRTDGRSIFLESLERLPEEDDPKVLDLKRHQYVFKKVLEQTFKDLDVEDSEVARWRPYKGRATIVVDPERAFGQPIAADFGVPTIALAEAAEAEGSVERVAAIFEVPEAVVRDALKFEQGLAQA